MEANILIILPFVLLLLSIAAMPFINQKWWDKNYSLISVGLALVVVVYYLVNGRSKAVLESIEEYAMFISFIFSLYVVAGGILIEIEGSATPFRNVVLLLAGAVLSNLVGTIGASIILIRPYIRTNKPRFSPYHIVFFIFIISNAGGLLTPIGNPPLLLGFLKGIPFFWISGRAAIIWLVVTGILVTVFYFFDMKNFKGQNAAERSKERKASEKVYFKGLLNFALMGVIIGSVFISKPVFLREVIMLAASFVSYRHTAKEIHEINRFSFKPIKEVSWLFFGIFVTMAPALELLSARSKDIALASPTDYYWLAGITSSVLDNAPTYLAFLTASMGSFGLDLNNSADVLKYIGAHELHTIAISIGSVVFGAATYIGNAPNFMVKSIAEHQGIKTPGFVEYIVKYSLPILLPLYVLIWVLFIL